MSTFLRSLLSLALVLFLSGGSRAEKPKFAVVDVSKAFEAYYVTIEEKSNIQDARDELKRDPRLEKIKLIKVELQELRDKVRDSTFTETERRDYFRQFQIKTQDLRALQRATVEHIDEQARVIDEAMVKRTRQLLGEVREVVQRLAAKEGFDFVFEVGGKTSSQIPSLIYIREATDLTDRVIEILNNDGVDPNDDIAAAKAAIPARP